MNDYLINIGGGQNPGLIMLQIIHHVGA